MIKLTIAEGQRRLLAEATRERLLALGLPYDFDTGSKEGRAAVDDLCAGKSRGAGAVAEVAPFGIFDYEAASKLAKKRWYGKSHGLEPEATDAARALTLNISGLTHELSAVLPQITSPLDLALLERITRRTQYLLAQLDRWLPNKSAKGAAAAEPAALGTLLESLVLLRRASAAFASELSKARAATLQSAGGASLSNEQKTQLRASVTGAATILATLDRLAGYWLFTGDGEPGESAPIHNLIDLPEVEALDTIVSGPALASLLRSIVAEARDPDSSRPPRAYELKEGTARTLTLTERGLCYEGSNHVVTGEGLRQAGWSAPALERQLQQWLEVRFEQGGAAGIEAANSYADRIEKRCTEIEQAYDALKVLPELAKILRDGATAFARGVELPLAAYAIKRGTTERIDEHDTTALYATVRSYRGKPLYGIHSWVRAAIDASGLVLRDEKNQPVDPAALYRAGLTPALLTEKMAALAS